MRLCQNAHKVLSPGFRVEGEGVGFVSSGRYVVLYERGGIELLKTYVTQYGYRFCGIIGRESGGLIISNISIENKLMIK